MNRHIAMLLAAAVSISLFPTAIAEESADLTDEITYSAYGGDGNWWDHSDAEVSVETDHIRVKNVDVNATYSAADVANAALGTDYTDEEITSEIAEQAQSALSAEQRTLGSVNHGLFSNRIDASPKAQGSRLRSNSTA